jgi:hypothetical protein
LGGEKFLSCVLKEDENECVRGELVCYVWRSVTYLLINTYTLCTCYLLIIVTYTYILHTYLPRCL